MAKTAHQIANIRWDQNKIAGLATIWRKTIHPALIQCYLWRWVFWWIHVTGVKIYDLITGWVSVADQWPAYIYG